MGSHYVNQDAFNPAQVVEESSSSTPIFFILFPGYSPSKEVEQYANKVRALLRRGEAAGEAGLLSSRPSAAQSGLTWCLCLRARPVLARSQMGKSVENGQLTLISMGQGQEGPAESVLDKYTKEGGWVFLDNVHLMQVRDARRSLWRA